MAREPGWNASDLTLQRTGATALAEQIARQVETAIMQGALPPGGRLPSWRDLAAQLGVARGTVKAAYERLIDRDLIVASGSAGTHVADPLLALPRDGDPPVGSFLPADLHHHGERPLIFQMGVPAHDAFPAKLWSRLHRQAARSAAMMTGRTDPRGLAELRSALAAHVAIARGIRCSPEQVIVTSGFRSGIAMALRAVDAAGGEAWTEEPGYPVVRRAVELCGLRPVAVRVDDEGVDVQRGCDLAPGAALAIITPGQQAPTGVTLSARRRRRLLRWASDNGSWIVEDDYLSELQLSGRPARALASIDPSGRVIHIGSFSKTLSPTLGIGFVVVPLPLARRLVDVAVWLASPPDVALQLALARFLREGHYLRHLRRMRQLYAQRRSMLLRHLEARAVDGVSAAGLSVMLRFPAGVDDQRLVERARGIGLGPAPLSPWFADARCSSQGLLLGITNVTETSAAQACARLLALISSTP
jgi:GntR family transcriptional regulator/MocR family aminotransferase